MAKAIRDLKIHLELTEEEARDIYLYLRDEVHPNKVDDIKKAIKAALGYEPAEPMY